MSYKPTAAQQAIEFLFVVSMIGVFCAGVYVFWHAAKFLVLWGISG